MKSAFCGTSLKTASFFVGWLGVVITTIQTVFVFHYLSIQDSKGDTHEDLPKIQFVYMDIPAIALNIVALVCLFYGLWRSSSSFLVIYISASVIIVLYNFALKVIWGYTESAVPIVHVLIALILGSIKLYFICVVSGYYQELRSGYEEIRD